MTPSPYSTEPARKSLQAWHSEAVDEARLESRNRVRRILLGHGVGPPGCERYRRVESLIIEQRALLCGASLEILSVTRPYLRELVILPNVSGSVDGDYIPGKSFWRRFSPMIDEQADFAEAFNNDENVNISLNEWDDTEQIDDLLFLFQNVTRVILDFQNESRLPHFGNRLRMPRPFDGSILFEKRLIDLVVLFYTESSSCLRFVTIHSLLPSVRRLTVKSDIRRTYPRHRPGVWSDLRTIVSPQASCEWRYPLLEYLDLDCDHGAHLHARGHPRYLDMAEIIKDPLPSLRTLVLNGRDIQHLSQERLESVDLTIPGSLETLIIRSSAHLLPTTDVTPLGSFLDRSKHPKESKAVNLIPSDIIEGLRWSERLTVVQFNRRDSDWPPARVPPERWEATRTYGVTIRTLKHALGEIYHTRTYSQSLTHGSSRPSADTKTPYDWANVYRDQCGERQCVWYAQSAEPQWEDATYHNGMIVPLEVIDDMYEAAGRPEVWEGRNIQVGRSAWDVFERWKTTLQAGRPVPHGRETAKAAKRKQEAAVAPIADDVGVHDINENESYSESDMKSPPGQPYPCEDNEDSYDEM